MVEGHVSGDVGRGEEEEIQVVDDDDNGDDIAEESSSSEEEEEEEDSKEKKRGKRESNIQKKVHKFWKERGLVKYAQEWQMHSASYIEECITQVKALKDKVYSLVCCKHFERITASTYTLGSKKEEAHSYGSTKTSNMYMVYIKLKTVVQKSKKITTPHVFSFI